MKKIVNAENAPKAIGPYSHAVAAGELLFTSGQIGLVPETGKLVEGGVTAEAAQAFDNLGAILRENGMDLSNVVKTTCFLTDLTEFSKVNAVYAEAFPTAPPARSCVQVAALPAGAAVEIEAVAVR